MTSIRVRPKIKAISPLQPDVLQQRIYEKLDQNPKIEGLRYQDHILLRIPKGPEYHFWSPQLDLNFDPHEQGTIIHGLYGPSQDVWQVFAVGYGIIGFSLFFLTGYVITAFLLKIFPAMLWVYPALILAAVLLYLFSQYGQKLGAEQTFLLHHFVEDALGEKVDIQ
ncbi:MAG: hypothetical protein J0L94_05310 [Rhodothermia bacterium]|nr:hypothetical protein [Rhodothermia bacterium]